MSVTNLLARLAGADVDVLDLVPSYRKRFVGLAVVMLGTAMVATLAMYFAITDALDGPPLAAAVVSALWGAFILAIDRFLVISMQGILFGWHLLVAAVPRVILAVIIGAVVSMPMTLRVFQSDVQEQLAVMNSERSQDILNSAQSGTERARLDEAREAYERNQAILRGDSGVTDKPAAVQQAEARVKALETELSNLESARNQAALLEICERTGAGREALENPNACSPQPGKNPPYPQYLADLQNKTRLVDQAASQLEEAKQALSDAEAAADTSQSDDLPRLQEQARQDESRLSGELADAQAAYDASLQDKQNSNDANDGLLAQIEALMLAGERNSSLQTAHRFIFLLFLMIELLPVLSKILASARSASPYDQIQEFRLKAAVDKARMDRNAENEIYQGKIERRTKAEEDLRQRELATAKKVNERVAAESEAVTMAVLKDWASQVRSQYSSNLPPPGLQHPQPSPPSAPAAGPTGGGLVVGGASAGSGSGGSGLGLPSPNMVGGILD